MTAKWISPALFLVAGAMVFAQTFTGSIQGVVADSSGAGITGATVRSVNTGTGETRAASTSDAGQYLITVLPPGEYRVSVELTGFKKFERSPIRIDVLQGVRVDIFARARQCD